MPGLDGTDRQTTRRRALYLCTAGPRRDLAEFADAALAGGVDIIQLREKGMEAQQEIAALEVLAEACERHGALLAVNDRADVALAVRRRRPAPRPGRPPRPVARRIVGDDVVIGRSTHYVDRDRGGGRRARRGLLLHRPVLADPDQAGPSGAGPAPSSAAAAANPTRPWFAIGGIDLTNAPEVLAGGSRPEWSSSGPSPTPRTPARPPSRSKLNLLVEI